MGTWQKNYFISFFFQIFRDGIPWKQFFFLLYCGVSMRNKSTGLLRKRRWKVPRQCLLLHTHKWRHNKDGLIVRDRRKEQVAMNEHFRCTESESRRHRTTPDPARLCSITMANLFPLASMEIRDANCGGGHPPFCLSRSFFFLFWGYTWILSVYNMDWSRILGRKDDGNQPYCSLTWFPSRISVALLCVCVIDSCHGRCVGEKK